MNLKHYFFICFLFGTLGAFAQSFSIGPYVEIGSQPYLGGVISSRDANNQIDVSFSEGFAYDNLIYPGILGSFYLSNGMIIDVNSKLIRREKLFTVDPSLESNGYYHWNAGLELYLPIRKISSEKAKMYYGIGLGYSGRRIGVQGINDLDGFEKYSVSNGIYASGHFRMDIHISDWFTLSPRANLNLFNVGFEKDFERSTSGAGTTSTSEFRELHLSNNFSPSIGIGALFNLSGKK